MPSKTVDDAPADAAIDAANQGSAAPSGGLPAMPPDVVEQELGD